MDEVTVVEVAVLSVNEDGWWELSRGEGEMWQTGNSEPHRHAGWTDQLGKRAINFKNKRQPNRELSKMLNGTDRSPERVGESIRLTGGWYMSF